MAQKQTNPFEIISQKFGDQELQIKLTTSGINKVCQFAYDGGYFNFMKPVWGLTSAGHVVANELATVAAVEEIIGDEVAFSQSLSSGTEIGTLSIGENTYTLYAPDGGGSSVSFSPAVNDGVTIGTLTIDGVNYAVKAPKPDYNASESDPDGIKNRPCYKTATGESYSGQLTIWSMTAEGTSYYYGTKINYLYGYEVTAGGYYKVTDANAHAQEFTSQAVTITTNQSFLTTTTGVALGNLSMLNTSYADTGEDLAILFYNWNGARCDAIVVTKYSVGNSASLNIVQKTFSYTPLEIGYIPAGISRDVPDSSSSFTLVAGKFNNMGTIDPDDLIYSSSLANAIVYGQFTSSATKTIGTGSGDLVYWRGDIELVQGNTYQFTILNSHGKIEKIMGV